MPRGVLAVSGADPATFRELAERLTDADLSLVESDSSEGPGQDHAWRDADYLLARVASNTQGASAPAVSGGEEPHWRLLPVARSLPGDVDSGAFVLGPGDLPPAEVATRLLACMERAELLTRQRELVEDLSQARRILSDERDTLRGELARTGRRLEERIRELSLLNRELERLKELNANIIEALNEGLIACDESGRISHWNRGATDLLGWERDEVMGKPLARFFRSPEAGDTRALELLSRSRDPGPFRFSLTGKSGESRQVELRASPLGTENGVPRGRVLLLTDLVKKQRIEEQARRRDRLASLGELSAGVAHEIRNPLAGIGTTAELLRSRLAPTAPEFEFAEVILEEVARLDKIITDLLTFAQPGRPQRVRRDIHRVLDRMLFLLRRQITHRGIQVVRRYQREVPRILFDPDQTLQLFLNVGLNAIEAMGDSGTLTVSTQGVMNAALGEGEEEHRPVLRVILQDTGPGIPVDHRDKVFNPFFTTKPKGSGLGLAICQRIVEEHGGAIYLGATPPQPTTVVVEFPLDAELVPMDEQIELFTEATDATGGHP